MFTSKTPTKMNSKPLIYSYFELVPNEEPHVGNKSFSTWQCKSDWCKKKVIIPGSTNSNLKTHLLTVKHKPEKEDFDKSCRKNSNVCLKTQTKFIDIEDQPA